MEKRLLPFFINDIIGSSMRKLFSVFIVLSVFSVSIWSLLAADCEACNSGHTTSKTCHTVEKTVEKSNCCEQEQPVDSCDMNNASPNDCQICAHTEQPPAKIEASVNLKMDKELVLAIPEARNAFSNQIPPPTVSSVILTESPPIVANHLVFLESIRLLI